METLTATLRQVLADDAWVLGLAVVTGLATVPLTAWVLVLMPEDYFVADARPFLAGRPLWLRVLATVVKNLAASVLLALGLVMTVPGIPGQGLLTLFVGVLLLDFPGKRALERRLFQLAPVHRVANAVRARFKRAPLLGLDRPAHPHATSKPAD
ncbi:MAG: hypothetical protein HY904_00790 [Deltaproteobacteria bacterium]|nr:hypothetical protein [Deltaproteobacteria bacterium]